MTKQLKKGLIAVLVVLMAVLVGFTANSVIGASQATDKSPIIVEFEGYISKLPDLTDEQKTKEYLFTTIVGANEANLTEAQEIWSAYNSAKGMTTEFGLSGADYNDVDENLRTRFETYDAIIDGAPEGETSAYGHLMRFRDTMKSIAEGWKPYLTYDSAYQLVIELGKDIKMWADNKATPGNIHYYIKYSSTVDYEYYEYERARRLMEKYENTFKEIGKLVGSIRYYDETAHTMKGNGTDEIYDSANKDHKIVLASGESIQKVTDELAGLAEVDRKYIKNPNGGSDEEGTTLATYEAALERFNALDTAVEQVRAAIETAWTAREEGVTYYTVRHLIALAENGVVAEDGTVTTHGYNTLVAESRYEGETPAENPVNYNDLVSKLENKDKLVAASVTVEGKEYKGMQEYLKDLDGNRIPAVEKLIAFDELSKEGIPELNEASYTIGYREAIEKAERAFDPKNGMLDVDIINHDAQVYEILTKRAAEGYDPAKDENKTADDKYLADDDAYMPEGQDYIVAGYDKLRDSRKQYDAWTAYIKGLLEKVEQIIHHQQFDKGEGVAVLLAELEAPYTNTGAPWQGKETKFHKNAFLYAATTEGETPIYAAGEYDFMIHESPYPPRADEKTDVTAYEVLSYFYKIKSEIYTKVNAIEKEIRDLVAAAAQDGCVYGKRDQLLATWDKYSALEGYVPEFDPNGEALDLRNWITNHAQLETMYNEFLEEDKLVKAWAEAVKTLKDEPVSVADFEAIAKVEEAFKAIVHYVAPTEEDKPAPQADEPAPAPVATADFGAFLGNEEIKDHGETKLNYSAEWKKYDAAIKARDLLKKTIDDLAGTRAEENPEDIVVDSMWEIDTDDTEDLLPLNQVVAWTNAVNAIKDRYEAIADTVKDAEGKDVANIDKENNIDYTGAQQYLQDNHKVAYANYEKALRLIDRYEVEAAIENIKKEVNKADPAVVTLAHKPLILNAWDLHHKYLTKYHTSEAENTDEWRNTPPHNDFRNDQDLHNYFAQLNAINQELNAWIAKVINLYYKDLHGEEFTAVNDLTATEAALNEGLNFKGYPLDLDAWKAVSDEYATLVGEDADKIDYVKEAKAVLGEMSKVDESGNVTEKATGLYGKSDEVIADLNARIKTLSEKINGKPATETEPAVEPQELNADDIKEVSAIQDRYNELHETQQDLVKGYDSILLDARDTLVAVQALKSMVEALYEEVVLKNNVTSYVQFYIDVVKTTYAQFPTDIRQSFDDKESPNFIKPNGYTKNLEKIQEVYDKALKEETVVRLSELKAAFDKAQAELIAALEGLSTLAEGDTSSALKDAFVKFETRITEAYTELINEKVSALRTELDTLIKAGDDKLVADLAAAKTELEGKIAELQAALEKETADRAAALDAVNKKVADLEKAFDAKLTEKLNALKAELQGLIDAEKAAREAGDAKATKDAADALKAAREALEAAIADANEAIAKESADRAKAVADVLAKANAAQSAADEAKAAVEALRDEMQEADEKLQKQIDEIKSTTTTLTILVIVLAVMVLAALACIIILFIKRK